MTKRNLLNNVSVLLNEVLCSEPDEDKRHAIVHVMTEVDKLWALYKPTEEEA